MRLQRVLRISRPRFWIYELGPYMIGILAAWYTLPQVVGSQYDMLSVSQIMTKQLPYILLFGFYFLIPANIWIYGINDIYDYETDKLNPKKLEGYEALVLPKEQKTLWYWIIATTAPFILLLGVQLYQGNISYETSIVFLAFLFFSGQYSAKPIRAKAAPILDSLFSAGHYITTSVFAYLLVNPSSELNYYYIAGGVMRAIAMHAFSAVPDIQADKDAKLATIATLLGGKPTICLCLLFYILSAVCSYSFLGIRSIILGLVYAGLMIAALMTKTEKKLFALYKRFPWINTLSGMLVFFIILLKIV